MVIDARHDYRALAHPLAQVEAASVLFMAARAFVADEWEDFYEDPPPREESLFENLEPDEFLDTLVNLGLRFELAGTDQRELDQGFDFWSQRYYGSTKQVLIYGWLQQVTSALEGEIDARVIHQALLDTDLIFVPDPDEIALAARRLVTDAMVQARKVEERINEETEREERLSRTRAGSSRTARGDGPRAKNPVLADRAALALRSAGKPLTPSEVAKRIHAKNIASVTTTLHQICTMRRPKRLAGWLRQGDDGRYAWIDES